MICYIYQNKRHGQKRKAWRGRFRLPGDEKITEIPLHTHDRQEAIRVLHRLVVEKLQERSGILPPKQLRQAAERKLLDHLKDMTGDLAKIGRDADYVYNVDVMVTRLAKECGWVRVADVTPDSFRTWRANQTHAPTTMNRYLETMKRFLNWLVDNDRLAANPLQKVKGCDTRGQQRRKRRALTADECRALLAVAGPRRIVYLAVLQTGLRRGEIAAVKWADFQLDGPRPYLKVRASISKNHKDATMKLHAELAEALRAHRPANALPTDLVFPHVPSMDQYRGDLDAAYIPYRDAEDRQADFHALRHTFGTQLTVNGASPRLVMELMRHSDIELTMKNYTDPMLLPTDEVIDRLPGFGAEAHNEAHKEAHKE